ncbi:MAG: SDR family NAD(P)-dependent oxidoreductase, partial [Nitrospinaceae bacterium]
MDGSLQDRKVVITGASAGIGRALALAFAAAGARVAGCARNAERLNHLAAEMPGRGHFFLPADVTHAGEIQTLHDRVAETFGGVDILVNNTGSIGRMAGFFDLTDEDWQAVFEVNLLSAVRMCRLFAPTLRHSGAPRIINISSIAGSRSGDMFPHYCAMKAGLSNLTASLAAALAPDNILVNTVSPGPVWTQSWEEEAQQAARQSGRDLQAVVREI